MSEQKEWNSEVPENYVRKHMEARRAAKELRKRLANEQAQRARQREAEAAGGTTPAAGGTTPAAGGTTPAAGGTTPVTTTQASRPPVYVKPTKTIPQHSNVAGVALRKRKSNGRKTRRRKTRSRK